MADATGTYVLHAWDGQPYHKLWKVAQTSRGLCWK
jgi:hypothetical protein